MCRIFNSLLGVWKYCQTESFMFDILRKTIVLSNRNTNLNIQLPPVLFVKDQPMVKSSQILIYLQPF